MVRIAVTPSAYRAIKALAARGFGRPQTAERDGGRYLLMLDENTVNSLNVQRRLGESISDVIIRLAQQGRLPT
jgi:hypothetical protein